MSTMRKTRILTESVIILTIIALNILCSCSLRSGERVVERGSTRTRIVMLGTGTPNAEPERSGPAVAIVVDSIPYIIDAGPGLVRRAMAAYELGIEGLEVSRLKRLFITHLHSDHTAGYPDFILTPWVLERDETLEVYGPPGIRSMTRHILKAYRKDIKVRLDGLEPINDRGIRVKAHRIREGVIYRDSLVRVTAFKVKHGSWKHAFGFRFKTPDRTIVISGDTMPVESIIEYARGCDVLIHEVYSQAGFRNRSPVWQSYHSSSHTSSVELAEIASRTRPKLLILYHQLLWGATPEELLAEIAEIYKGRVVYGNDLEIY